MIPLVEVYDARQGQDVLIGTARFSLRRGSISTTFSYDDGYLANPTRPTPVDPAFPLAWKTHHCNGLPGAFRDSSPDRWGRHLIDKEHRSKVNDRELPASLDEVDYLLGVFDQTREGSLRFKEPNERFLAQSGPIPPTIQLPELLNASRMVARDAAGSAQIKELLDAGSASLGGARPKASVCDGEKLLLAKFPHPGDAWNVMAWEKTALDLARAAHIPVPASKLIKVGTENVLLLDRFDREGSAINGRRIGYMSGMTALQATDGETRDYVELGEALLVLTLNPKDQRRQLFRRVVFNAAINNTDDHLRNWAFLQKGNGWELSPAFDLNPNPYGLAHRATTIAGTSGDNEARGVKELAAYLEISEKEATQIVSEVLPAISQWKAISRKNGCSEKEQSLFAGVFAQKERELRQAFGL